MTISTQRLRFLRGNTAASGAFTGLQGELIVDTDLKTIRVQDGVTAGGTLLATAAQLANVSANLSLGNLVVVGQTITGTLANSNIGISPNGYGGIVHVLGNPYSSNIGYIRMDSTSSTLVRVKTFDGYNLELSTSNTSINLSSTTGHIGFNQPPSTGYTYAFNSGSLYSREFYADANFPTGYQFTTPQGLTGLGHSYQNDIQGNISMVRISHDSNVVARFYENLTTTLSGNLTVTQNGNTFGSFPNAFVQVYSNVNSYSQSVFQNLNNGSQASVDLILTAGNGNDSAYFGDLGIASNTYSYPGYGVIKPNDVYLLAVGNNITGPGSANKANLILGSTDGNINFFVGAPEDANVIASISNTGLIPGANVAYSLGSSSKQWKDLWLSNSTMYLGGFPITVTANGVLQVNGSVVSGNYGDANVAVYAGNIVPGNVNLSGIGTSGKLQFKAAAGTNGAYIYDSSGSIFLAPNTTYSATAGVTIGGLGYLLSPNGARNITLNYNSVNGQVGVQANLVVGTTASGGNLTVANSIVASGNITGTYFIGNGALLTGIAASSTYGNTNVSAFLGSYGSNTIVTTGNVTAGNLIGTHVGNASGTTATYTGNVTGNNIVANSFTYANGVNILTGVAGNYSNVNVAAYLPTYTGNISSNISFANGNLNLGGIQNPADQTGTLLNVKGIVGMTASSGANISGFSTISAANFTFTNGQSILSGISGTYSNANVASYLPTYTGNITAGNILSDNHLYANGVSILAGIAGNYGNTNVAAYLSGNVSIGNLTANTNVTVTSNLIVGSGAGGFLFRPLVGGTGATIYSLNAAPSQTNYALSYNGASLNLNAPTGGGIYSSIQNSIVTTLTSTGLAVTGVLSATGNISAGNIIANQFGNSVGTTATYTGNVTGNFFIGNGSQLTGIVANTTYSNTNVASYLTGNITVGNISGSQPGVTLVANTYSYLFSNVGNVSFPGNLTVTANTSVGNIFATGYYYANGTAFTGTGGSSNYGNTNVAAYLPTYTGDIGANIVKNGQTWTFASDGNLSVPGSIVPAFVTSPAPVISGFDISTNQITATGNITANGNVTASYFVGNGALLTGIVASGANYSNANVVSMLAANTAVFIGNVGNVSVPSVYPLQSNITQLFVGNNAGITSGNGSANSTQILYNTYISANGTPFIRNTQTGAGIISFDPSGFSVSGLTSAVTANTSASLTRWITANAVNTTFSLPVVSTSSVTAAGFSLSSGSFVTSVASLNLFQTTATTINLGGAASAINMGASTGSVVVAGNVWVGGAVGNNTGTLTVRAIGTYNTLTLYNSQGGYNSPPYSNVALTGGSGTGMTASWSSVGGYVNGAVTLINPGTGYRNGDILTLPGGIGSTVILSNYNPNISNGTTVGSANCTLTLDGNLTLPGNVTYPANSAIYGDFSNNTVNNRTIFKTTTANSTTGIYAVPNGTSTGAAWQAANSSNLTNASKIMITTNGNTDVQLVSGINGSGTYLPLSFYNNGSAQMQLSVSGNLSMTANNNVIASGTGSFIGNLSGATATMTGNVSASYFVGNGALLTGISASSSYGNANVAAFLGSYGSNTIVTTGNVDAGFVRVNSGLIAGLSASPAPVISGFGLISTTGVAGNITASGNLIANADALITGNVTANYFVGNGSTLTGLVYNNIGNIYGAQPNVTLQAGSYSWTFDNTGNLVIPTTSNIVYANGAVFSSGGGGTGNYSNTNVSAFLASFGTNTISTTGNITAGNINANQFGNSTGTTATYTGNVSVGNLSVTGNIVDTGALSILSGTNSNLSLIANGTGIVSVTGALIGLGNVVTAYPTQNTITTVFIGNNTTITAGGSSNSSSYMMNNLYFQANGQAMARNTNASGAGQFEIAGATFNWNAVGAATANTAAGMGSRMTLNSTALATQNSVGITSAGTLTVQGASGIVTTQTTFPLLTTTATTINFGNSASVIAMGANVGSVIIGNSVGNITAGNIIATQFGNSTGTTATYTGNVTAGNLVTTGVVALSGGNVSGVGNLVGLTSNTTITAGTYVTSFLNNGSVATNSTVTVNTANINAPALQVTGNYSGINVLDFLKVTNTYSGVTNPIKVFRIDNTGTLQILNSTQTGYVLEAADNGNTTIYGNLTVNGTGAVAAPNRAAFRVYGNTSTNFTAGTTISNQAVDYNQGSYYDNSTGLFTAPAAGLYHCFATIRVGNNNALNQASLQKNSSNSGANVIAFWETDTNTGTATHFSITGYAKCVVGDTIRLRVVLGNVQFDSNDSWGVTFIG